MYEYGYVGMTPIHVGKNCTNIVVQCTLALGSIPIVYLPVF